MLSFIFYSRNLFSLNLRAPCCCSSSTEPIRPNNQHIVGACWCRHAASTARPWLCACASATVDDAAAAPRQSRVVWLTHAELSCAYNFFFVRASSRRYTIIEIKFVFNRHKTIYICLPGLSPIFLPVLVLFIFSFWFVALLSLSWVAVLS